MSETRKMTDSEFFDAMHDGLQRPAVYEKELERAATLLQAALPIGKVKAIGLREVATGIARLVAERDEAVPYMQSLRKAHNGYDPECRKAMPNLVEPATPEQAIKELNEEHEWMLDAEADRRAAAEAEAQRLREGLEALKSDIHTPIDLYERLGPTWTSRETGKEYYGTSYVINKLAELEASVDALLAPAKEEHNDAE